MREHGDGRLHVQLPPRLGWYCGNARGLDEERGVHRWHCHLWGQRFQRGGGLGCIGEQDDGREGPPSEKGLQLGNVLLLQPPFAPHPVGQAGGRLGVKADAQIGPGTAPGALPVTQGQQQRGGVGQL